MRILMFQLFGFYYWVSEFEVLGFLRIGVIWFRFKVVGFWGPKGSLGCRWGFGFRVLVGSLGFRVFGFCGKGACSDLSLGPRSRSQ